MGQKPKQLNSIEEFVALPKEERFNRWKEWYIQYHIATKGWDQEAELRIMFELICNQYRNCGYKL